MELLTGRLPLAFRGGISEADYLRLARDAEARKASHDGKSMKAELLLADGTKLPYPGSLDAVERAVDPQTGTLSLQISFPNPDRLLRPGQYGRVRFESESKRGALLIPQRAVQELQETVRRLEAEVERLRFRLDELEDQQYGGPLCRVNLATEPGDPFTDEVPV